MVMRVTCVRCGLTEFCEPGNPIAEEIFTDRNWNLELTDDEDVFWFCPSCHQEMLKEKEQKEKGYREQEQKEEQEQREEKEKEKEQKKIRKATCVRCGLVEYCCPDWRGAEEIFNSLGWHLELIGDCEGVWLCPSCYPKRDEGKEKEEDHE